MRQPYCIKVSFIFIFSHLFDDHLYTELLETVLFANIRFHDTVSRGRLLNRFGKDIEGLSSSMTPAAYFSRRRRNRQQAFR